MKTKKAIQNFFYFMLSQIVTIGIGLIVPRITMVGYGSEVNGLLTSVTQFIVYLNLFEAGVQAVAMQALYKPVSMKDELVINRILSAVNKNYKKTGIFYLITLCFLSLVYPFFVKGNTINYWIVFMVFLFSGLGNVVLFFFQGKYRILLQVEGKGYVVTNIQTIINVLNNVIKIVLLYWGFNIAIVILCSFLVSFVQVIYICVYIKRKYNWINLKVTPDYSALAQKNSVLIHQLAGMVFHNTDVLILTVFCGLKVVSVYSLYKMVVSHIGSLLNSSFNSVSFALGQTYSTNKLYFVKLIDAVEVFFSGTVFSIYTVVSVLFIPFVKLYTRGVTDIVYVDMYVCILFVVAELLNYVRMPMLNTINYAGHFKNTLPQTLIETTINLITSLLAVNFWGIRGVLLGTVLALLYRSIEVIIYTNCKILDRRPLKTFSIYAVNVTLLVIMVAVLGAFNINIQTYFDFGIAGIIITPIIFVIYMLVLGICYREEREIIVAKLVSFIIRKRGVKE